MADAIQNEFKESRRNSEVMAAFGYRLHNAFTTNASYRRPKELEWLEDLRQYKGLYDPDVKIETNASKVYPKLTRSKVNIVLSRLHEMLFPSNERNWNIEPTPDPRISKDIVTQIAISLVQQDPQTGQKVIPTADELQAAISEFVRTASEKMRNQIDDQLLDMGYSEETKKVLRSGLIYGTGIMKGPMIHKREKHKWEPDTTTGEYVESATDDELPYYEFVRIWDWYPDMTVVDIDKLEGSFQRHVMNKHDLRQMMKRPDFYADVIKTYMEAHPEGDYVAKNWEVDLQVIEIEAGAGKDNRTTTTVTGGTDDLNRSTNRQLGKRYEVLEYWGYVDGTDLEACGVDMAGRDVELEYAAHLWLLGKHIISAALFSEALDEYKVFYYEKDETSIFGEGLARVMRHSQLAIAGAARMTLDNGAVVAGPQVELNWSLLAEGQDMSSFHPRKIWWRKGTGVEAQYPAVRGLEFQSHIEELIAIANFFKQFADEETCLPTWIIGQMVSNETAQASSGRQATITISIKDVVRNFDTFTEKIIAGLYNWNMEFNPRQDIKGDYEVKATGSISLVMKEIRMQALNQFAQTLTPEDWDYFDRRDFLAERMRVHDINLRMKSEPEAQKSREQRENSKAQQLVYAQMEADVAYTRAQTMAQLTKAKQKNVEAVKMASEPPEGQETVDPRMQDAELIKKQEEINALRQKQALELEKHEAELQTMMQKSEQERTQAHVQTALDVKKAVQDTEIKQKESEHGMQVHEKAAMIKAKQKPAAKTASSTAKKPAKGVKK